MNFQNVAEGYPIFDSVIISQTLYGKEQAINGWFNTFQAFAANEKHTFYKDRTIGSANLAYCNMDSADNLDYVFKAHSFGVRFFAPITPDAVNAVVESPTRYLENCPAFWLFEMPKHCGIDLRIQQDVVVENTCIATPSGYGPMGGGGAQPHVSGEADVNQITWKTITGTIGTPCIDNRFPFPEPLPIPRNTPIEANIYVAPYARWILSQLSGPHWNVMLSESQADGTPGLNDFISLPQRYGIQVSLYGMREVQQRGQYFAPSAIVRGDSE